MGKTLRTQFLDHMVLHRFSPWTIKNYMATMTRLAKFYNKSPDLITNEQIQDYLLYLLEERKLSWGTCNVNLSGMSCFYKKVLKWDEAKFKLPPRQRIKKLPNILSVEEVKRLFECTTILTHRWKVNNDVLCSYFFFFKVSIQKNPSKKNHTIPIADPINITIQFIHFIDLLPLNLTYLLNYEGNNR